MLTEKYRPGTLKDVIGQSQIVENLKGWFENWKPGDKALFLYGPPGIGKTCIVEAFTEENKLELVEMNASDYRTEENIKKIAGNASNQVSLSGKKKLILIDEVDGLNREESVTPLVNLVKNSKFPVIMTANDAWDLKIRPIHSVADLVQLKKLTTISIAKKLKDISLREKLNVDDDLIKSISEQSSGDLRSAINDLESFSTEIGQRERKSSIFDIVRKILKSESIAEARSATKYLSEDPEYLFWWIETNVIEEYSKPEDLSKAMQALALADLFRTRIRNQNWKMLGYFIDSFAAGTALAKSEQYKKFVMYKPPEIIATLGRTKKVRTTRKELCKKIGRLIHESSETVNSEYLPFIKIISGKNDVSKSFNLTEEESEILKNI